MVSNVPYCLTIETELVFIRLVRVFVNIPVRVYIIWIQTIPIRVFTVFILIVFQPFLIVCSGKSHKVFTDITFAVAKSRTVLYRFACIVCTEIQIYFSHTRIGTQIEYVTAHIGIRNYIFITHIGVSETYSRLSMT